MSDTAVSIDPEFKALIPPLSAQEREQLEVNIAADGVRDPLVVWRGILLDGHNRHEIATRLGKSYQVVEKQFATRDEAILWVVYNQFGRRNLSTAARAELAMRIEPILAAQAKARQLQGQQRGGEIGGRGRGVDSLVPKSEPSYRDMNATKTATQAAEAAGLKRDTYHKAKTVLTMAPEPIVEAFRAGELSTNQAYQMVTKPHVAHNSGNNEWYTPAVYIDLAHEVLGGIDLDPASSEIANRTVGATMIYTAEDDGLSKQWPVGRIWMNPPYAQPLIGEFCERLAQTVERGAEAIVLVNNGTETAWFQRLGGVCSAMCFPQSRIRFLDQHGNPGAPLQGQAFIYCGPNPQQFMRTFASLGLVMLRA